MTDLILAAVITCFAPPENLKTPTQIISGKFEGEATVEFKVAKCGRVLTNGVTRADECEMLQLQPKDEKFILYLTRETATRLKQLGIDDPATHFEGKLVRVTGSVVQKLHSDGKPWFEITVSNLEQIAAIRKP
ncbi:hypothetical protein KIH39_02055 [Telmatocola sphagniphila]|uniref:Uncharacterized protein n=1 Tax=Telmatocola sphagniphila TaxID=1123043 RepID=A0A8E6EYU8_9BACT|nr:hypothetical protein [Telmatocola sphagniphila]QVL32726.1 hypothetical protein KIH39_02055 [Telmatocola sphagniphila]